MGRESRKMGARIVLLVLFAFMFGNAISQGMLIGGNWRVTQPIARWFSVPAHESIDPSFAETRQSSVLIHAPSFQVPVTIYYESLCEDSAKFISEQVYPAVKGELKDYVDITWVPFGKSQYSTQGSDVMFTCHHGPNECYGNKVHACALEHIEANSYQNEFTRESLKLDFITCMMKAGKNFPDNVYPGERCAQDNHISTWRNIQECANSTEGSQLLKKQGDITNSFQMPLTSVPTVVFKQQYDAKVNEHAMSNFLGAVCKVISQPLPRVCEAHNAAVSIAFAPLTGLFAYALSRLL